MRKTLAYTVSTIEKVEDYDSSYSITFDGSTGFGLKKSYDIEPKVGDHLEVYGSFGSSISGVCINGKTAFFKGERELENDHQEWCKNRKLEQQENFDKNKSKLDANFESLPDVFKKRIEKFRAAKSNFRVESEAYEMSCCIDAVKIADTLKTVKALDEWKKLGYKEQTAQVTGLYDGHSGNSFGMACRLAYWYIMKPENVWQEHGALATLVSCEEYGCHSKEQETL